jgi:hypothetical protein
MEEKFTILVVDDHDRRAGIAVALERAVPAGYVAKVHQHTAGSTGWMTSPGEGPFDLAFCHAGNLKDPPREYRKEISRAKVLVYYSGGGRPSVPNLAVNILCFSVPRPIQDQSYVSGSEWAEFIKWALAVSRAATDVRLTNEESRLPRLLRSDYPRVSVALLILCRAALALLDGSISGTQERRTIEGIWIWMREPFPNLETLSELEKELPVVQFSDGLKRLVKWLKSGASTSIADISAGNLGCGTTNSQESSLRVVLIEAEACLARVLDATPQQ